METTIRTEEAPPSTTETGSPCALLVPGPAALERVAGVALVRRAAIVLRRAGFEEIALDGGADVAQVAGLGEGACVSSGPVLLALGDVSFAVRTLEALRAQGPGVHARSEGGLLVLAERALVDDVLRAHKEGGLAAASAAAARLTRSVEAPLLLDASTSTARRLATRATLAATGKAVDGPLTRLFERRISQTISGALLPYPVSPNVMTTVSFAIGLTGAGLLATTDYWLRVIGAALFVFATIVDGCDGEIARAKFLESSFGKTYDTAVDIVVNAAVFIGLGAGTWRELGGIADVQWAALALVAGGVLAMASVESVRRFSPPGASSSHTLTRARVWLEWFATVEWCYLVLGLAILGQLPFFFFGAAVGANVFAVIYLVLGVIAWRRG
jgi:phosphatidylglycerophosphate synthase